MPDKAFFYRDARFVVLLDSLHSVTERTARNSRVKQSGSLGSHQCDLEQR